jgi:hypothetical protein
MELDDQLAERIGEPPVRLHQLNHKVRLLKLSLEYHV